MDRLTERTADGILTKEDYGEGVLKTLYQCFGAEPMPHYANCDEGYCAMEKLAEYEDLEEQGKLLKLPCAVGDTVWFIKSNFSYMQKPKSERVRKIEIIDGEIIFRTENRCFEMKYIGKTVFLTRPEAEAKLAEMEGKK